MNIYPAGICVTFQLEDDGTSRTGTVIENRGRNILIRPDDVRHTLIEVPALCTRRATIRESLEAAEAWWQSN